MKIGFDATPLAGVKAGIGWYTENLIRAIVRTGKLSELVLFSNRPPRFDGDPPPEARWVSTATFPYRAPWMQAVLPALVAREKPDLVHYPNFIGPGLFDHPFVTTFHDMVLFRHPEFFTWKKRFLTRALMPRMARRALGVITVSDAVRREILETLSLPEERVFVVPNAAGEVFGPQPPATVEAVLDRHGVTRPYILFVGTLEPRKNLARTLLAFDRFKSAQAGPHQLAVVGGRGWKYGPIFEHVENLRHRDSVRFLDYVALEDLPSLYSGADVFLFPSIYEGFGIPLVEAMKCGAPMVCSDIPVHREVAGEAAVYCNAFDVDSIARSLTEVVADEDVAARLRAAGRVRAERYDWDISAEKTVEVYRTLLARRESRS